MALLEAADDKWLVAHLEDLDKQSSMGGYVTVSDFLDERQQSLLSRMEGRLSSCIWLYGGDEGCERKTVFLLPDYLMDSKESYAEDFLRLIRIYPADARFIKSELTHRDYLGSIMGLGIKREKIGDIRPSEDGCYVVVKEEIADFLSSEISSVGRVIVKTEILPLEKLPPAPKGEFSLISVSSLRLDALVSRGFNTGRTEAAKWISAGAVFRNGVLLTDTDKQMAIGDRITVRGKGRIILKEDRGVSRSGRKQILIERFGK